MYEFVVGKRYKLADRDADGFGPFSPFRVICTERGVVTEEPIWSSSGKTIVVNKGYTLWNGDLRTACTEAQRHYIITPVHDMLENE